MNSVIRDFVEREVVVRAPIESVFAAVTDPSTFPTWGPEAIEGELIPGRKAVLDFGERGGGRAAIHVVAVEPPRYFAFRWAQGETDPELLLRDPILGPNTLVEFTLESVEEGTRVKVHESGISALPTMAGLQSPAEAEPGLQGMSSGWGLMLAGLARRFNLEDRVADAITNEVDLAATPAQVYEALRNPAGWWAQSLKGAMEAGELVTIDFGQYGKWTVDIVATEPNRYIAYRRAHDGGDPRSSPNTLVEFFIEQTEGGVHLRQVESGFLALPGENVDAAFQLGHQVWGIALGLLTMKLAHT